MAIIPFNLQNLRTRAFKGFIQFQDPSTSDYLRLKERQQAQVTFRWDREGHYDDAGIKVLDPFGHTHTFEMTLKLTSDLIDDEYNKPPSNPDATADKKTVSYWMLKNELYEPIQIIFVTTLEAREGPTGDSSEKFLHFKFVLDPQKFGPIALGATGGTVSIPVSGEVISISEVRRTATQDAP